MGVFDQDAGDDMPKRPPPTTEEEVGEWITGLLLSASLPLALFGLLVVLVIIEGILFSHVYG